MSPRSLLLALVFLPLLPCVSAQTPPPKVKAPTPAVTPPSAVPAPSTPPQTTAPGGAAPTPSGAGLTPGAASTCTEKSIKVQVVYVSDSGGSYEGPLCVRVVVNILRYNAEIGRTITYTSGPDPNSILGTSSTTTGGAASSLVHRPDPTTVEEAVSNLNQYILDEIKNTTVMSISAEKYSVEELGAVASLNALLSNSDSLIKSGVQTLLDASSKVQTTLAARGASRGMGVSLRLS